MEVIVIGVRGLPNVQGGVETHAEQLYQRLVPMQCDVEVVVRSPYVPSEQKTFKGISLRRLWSPTRPGLEALIHSLLGVLYAGIKRPDILHIHAVGPAIVTPIARLLGLRVVVTHHGVDYEREKWGAMARWILRLGERYGMRYANARIAISTTLQNLVRDRYGRPAHFIPNGVVVADPAPEAGHLRRFGLEPNKYFLQVSRMVPEKRQLDLIRAYAQTDRKWKLALAGGLDSSPYAQRVKAAAAESGVVLTDFVTGEPLHQLYSHAGAFVLPSSHEGLPIALLEALAYGLPAIASNIPANLEIGMEPQSYFPLGDIQQLTASLMNLENAVLDRDIQRRRSLAIAAQFDWARIAQQTLEVYRSVAPRSVVKSRPAT